MLEQKKKFPIYLLYALYTVGAVIILYKSIRECNPWPEPDHITIGSDNKIRANR